MRRRRGGALALAVTGALLVLSGAPAGALVMSWGPNSFGQLGSASRQPYSDIPVPVSGLGEVREVSAGGGHTLALLDDGTVMVWGRNRWGDLGTGSSSGPEGCSGGNVTSGCARTPIPVGELTGVVQVSAGDGFSLALLREGTVMAWGRNGVGQLGDGTHTSSYRPVPVRGLTTAVQVKAAEGRAWPSSPTAP